MSVSVATTYCGPQDPKPYTLEWTVRELCCLKEEEKEGEILPSSLENKQLTAERERGKGEMEEEQEDQTMSIQ